MEAEILFLKISPTPDRRNLNSSRHLLSWGKLARSTVNNGLSTSPLSGWSVKRHVSGRRRRSTEWLSQDGQLGLLVVIGDVSGTLVPVGGEQVKPSENLEGSSDASSFLWLEVDCPSRVHRPLEQDGHSALFAFRRRV